MEQKLKHLVYGLVDPRSGELKYVGKSSIGMRRPRKHQLPTGRKQACAYNGNWLRSMYADGETVPSILVLKECTSEEEAYSEEKSIIKLFRESEFSLTNMSDGGEGMSGFVMPESARAKISKARMGMKFSAEHLANLSRAHMGYKPSDETRARRSATMRERGISPENRAKMVAGMHGHKMPEAVKEALRRANVGRKASPETRAKLSARLMGNKYGVGRVTSEATRALISAAGKGRVVSEQTKARQREAWVRRKAKQAEKEGGTVDGEGTEKKTGEPGAAKVVCGRCAESERGEGDQHDNVHYTGGEGINGARVT